MTVRCISVSARPGRLGMAMHNAGYAALGLDYSYLAMGSDEIAPVLAMVRAEKVRGCSVSMPFKEKVLPLLDRLDPTAAKVGAVNTVVNDDGELVGHNTDATGLKAALKVLEIPVDVAVQVLGAGGVARAAAWALSELGYRDVSICARRAEQAGLVAAPYGFKVVGWESRGQGASLLVNATPMGMAPQSDEMPVEIAGCTGLTAVADLVANPPVTRLVLEAREAGLKTLTGVEITLEQALHQFELYTRQQAPRAAMAAALMDAIRPQ